MEFAPLIVDHTDLDRFQEGTLPPSPPSPDKQMLEILRGHLNVRCGVAVWLEWGSSIALPEQSGSAMIDLHTLRPIGQRCLDAVVPLPSFVHKTLATIEAELPLGITVRCLPTGEVRTDLGHLKLQQRELPMSSLVDLVERIVDEIPEPQGRRAALQELLGSSGRASISLNDWTILWSSFRAQEAQLLNYKAKLDELTRLHTEVVTSLQKTQEELADLEARVRSQKKTPTDTGFTETWGEDGGVTKRT